MMWQESFLSFLDSHVPHGEIGNLYDFLYQLKHLKVSCKCFYNDANFSVQLLASNVKKIEKVAII